MQRLFTYTFILVCGLLVTAATAQNRFIDPIFEVGAPETGVTYASNISILTGAPALEELKMDVYQPANDNEGLLRPVVVVFHTGNFLPPYLNGGAYGGRLDSANVEIIKRLTSRGFVGISATYRQGWLPLATDQDTRTGTLLQAAYRGGQDAHAMARYLRKSVVEDGNPYQIDTTRIVFWGMGTGGYVTFTHAFLDRVDEILQNEQFYDVDGNPLVVEALNGNPQGTNTTPLNNPSHAGYNSNVAMSVNMGGALGDPNWIEGAANEPMIVGYHSFTDPFAPFYTGTVIVPTTGNTVVDGVAGTNLVIELADNFGLNTALAPANELTLPSIYPALSSVINQINAQYKQALVTSPINNTGDTFNLSRDNMFPHVYSRVISGPYNWFDEPTLRFIVSMIPAQFMVSADAIIAGENFSNPNWNMPEVAKTTIDTVIAHFIPRAYIGLDLANPTSVEELVSAAAIGMQLSPNPARDYLLVETEADSPIIEAAMYDINGRQVAVFKGVNNSSLRINSSQYPKGYYVLKVRVPQGVSSQKVMIH